MTRRTLALTIAALLVAGRTAAQHDVDPRTETRYPWLRIGGFSDFNFTASDEKKPGSTSGFREGQFVLHFTSALAPRFSFFGEMSMSAGRDEFKPEIERTILKFDANDYLRFSAGRYHTPINWWNTAYHHGQWLQTTVSRPEMTKFGGAFIPVHFVGVLIEGSVPVAGVNLNYNAGAGNGRSSNPVRGGDADDVNNDRAWLANLALQPDRLYELQAGGAIYRDLIAAEAAHNGARETIASGFVVWTRETPELLGEFAFVQHEDAVTGRTEDSQAWYVQASYRLPLWQDRAKPYVRFERVDVSASDRVFSGRVSNLEQWTVGLRHDVSNYVAFKGEYRLLQSDVPEDVNALFLQASFAF